MAANWYRTGTISLTQGSREVSGAGTAFLANVRAGDMLIGPLMDMYEITDITSDVSAQIDKDYAGPSYSGSDWSIAPTSANLKQLAQQIAGLVALYQEIPDTVAGSVTAAEAAAQGAQSARQAAEGSASAAETSRGAAESAAASAAQSATAAAESKADVDGARDAAVAARDGAVAAKESAESTASAAATTLSEANAAVDSANASVVSANESVASVQALAESANTAAQEAKEVSEVADGKASGAVSTADDAVALALRLGSPVGTPEWWPWRPSIQAGRIPGDGQIVNRATYPELTQMVIAGLVPVVPDVEWLADPLKRGCYTLGDGSTTIRVPDYNGKSPGSLGAIFLRGDGLLSAGTNGLIQRDALQNITGRFTGRFGAIYTGGTDGAIQVVTVPTSQDAPLSIGTGTQPQFNISFDASRVARTATETRPLAVSGCFVIKAFGVVVNPGSVDAAQLASDYAVLNAAVQTLNGQMAQAFGVGQSAQNMMGSRAYSVQYVNTTGRPIRVSVTASSTNSVQFLRLQVLNPTPSSQDIAWSVGTTNTLTVSGIIAAWETYMVDATAGAFTNWVEYR